MACSRLILYETRRHMDNVYTLRDNSVVANGIDFDRDAMNTKHLAAHKVTAREFESVMQDSPWIWRTRCWTAKNGTARVA